MAQIRVCHIQCFNATEEMLLGLVIPKERSGGSYSIKCMISAFNETSREAWIFAQFERLKENVLERALEGCGASQISITSYSTLDYATTASSGLSCVMTKSKTVGFKLIHRGSPSQYIQDTNDFPADNVPSEIAKLLDSDLKEAEERSIKLELELQSKENDMALLVTENRTLKTRIKDIESYRANVGAKDKEIEQLKEKLQNNETSRKRMEEQSKRGCQLIQQKDSEIAGLKREVEEYKASGNNKGKDTEIQKLKDSNEKLQKEGQAARAENYTLKQRLGSDEHRKSNLFTFQNQLDQSRQDGADKLTRLSQEKDAVIRDLKARLEASGGGAEIQQIKSLAERNKTLNKQVEELAGLKTPGIYEALLAVAKMMGEVNRDSSGAEGQQLKDLTLELVQRTLNGNGYPPATISTRSAPVYAGFFSAYSKAARTEQESYAQRVSGGMVKRKKI